MDKTWFHESSLGYINIEERLPPEPQRLEMTEPRFDTITQKNAPANFLRNQTVADRYFSNVNKQGNNDYNKQGNKSLALCQ